MNEQVRKDRVLSCIQPTGTPTLGNYLGALRNWVAMQDEFECAYALADLHAITVRQEAAKLRTQIYEMSAFCTVAGSHPRTAVVDAFVLHPVRRIDPYDAVQGQSRQARR